ncbi:MAG: SGNH/GDSL hydrolase family protein [Isosphaeraceae bacterium]
MSLFEARKNRGSRNSGSRRRTAFTLETLEVRSLLSAAPVIQWAMAPQIFLDPNHGNEPDLPNTPAYVNPPSGYGVLLNAAHSTGTSPRTTFAWTVTNSVGQTTALSGEHPSINLPQGTYTVKLTATGLSKSTRPLSVTTKIQVKDVLIVSIGDSYASGEGNPVVPGVFFPEWAYSPNPAMNLENADAHRSTITGSAEFALALQRSNPHEAVTFVSVAASGASIPEGLLGPMASIGDSSYVLQPQLTELKQIIGNRHIDVLTISVGGDDLGFTTLVEDLIGNTTLGTPVLASIQSFVNTGLSALPGHYAALDQALESFDPGEVLITPYPDLTRDQHGKVVAVKELGITAISKADAQFASQDIIAPLNSVMAAAAGSYHWTLVPGITSDFRTHGYPSTNSWFRTLDESLAMEGSRDGVFHPNAAGQQDIAKRLLDAYLENLDKSK